ncbi:MAG: sigma-70 family RNA polymerase sigma factor, partial [Acidobacteriota bacterium]|nr:sigma-70 family RNA polymerase sigma factor [Acidobacteriota bacterium]
MLKPREITPGHEELFIERYDRLLSWALQLTNYDRCMAEDLVHDAFIQFTFTHPDLNVINNLDNYLYGMLRNLHLSQMRWVTRSRFQQLSIVEYDSAELGLRSVDVHNQIQVQDELRRICHYACARKETARAASVMILRFFHGYYPSEIAQILRSSRQAVSIRLRLAR